MNRLQQIIAAITLAMLCVMMPATVGAQEINMPLKMYELVKPSLVAVKYTWESEIGSRELGAAGIIIDEKGLVMMPIDIVSPPGPESQMKDFKIILPSDTEDETEVDAVLQGRDERTGVAFVRAVSPQHWAAVKFVNVVPGIGEPVYSVGILPRGSGYKAHVTSAMISAILRGPVPQILIDGSLAGVGGVVLDAKGEALGYVHARGGGDALLDIGEDSSGLPMVDSPPKLFIPSYDFLQSIQDPPTDGSPLVLPWIGCAQLKGLEQAEAEYYGLKNKPAVQISEVIPGAPADKAGLKTLDIITKMNGEPLERGDLPLELSAIITRKIQRMKVGDKVTFTIIHNKGDEPRDVTVTLEPRPKQPNEARRFYAKDLGFVVREVVFADTYRRKLAANTGGVVVALLRPQAAAMAARLANNGLVTQMNGKSITDIDQFKKDYQQIRKDRPHDPVVLEVTDANGSDQTINIEPPQTGAVPGADNQ